jgi:hypothetical protein
MFWGTRALGTRTVPRPCGCARGSLGPKRTGTRGSKSGSCTLGPAGAASVPLRSGAAGRPLVSASLVIGRASSKEIGAAVGTVVSALLFVVFVDTLGRFGAPSFLEPV